MAGRITGGNPYLFALWVIVMQTVADRIFEITRNLPESKALAVLKFAESMQTKPDDEENDFFALAGLWEGRDIDPASLRKKAWPEQSP
ncbi:hypothetical protein [Methylomagnum sp.]